MSIRINNCTVNSILAKILVHVRHTKIYYGFIYALNTDRGGVNPIYIDVLSSKLYD